MSRISSDLKPTRAPFGRVFAIVVGVLVVLCGVFLALAYLQGPKLADAQIDLAAVIEKPDQQLRLFVNQAIDDIDASQVTVTPDATTSVTTSDELIAVQFAAPLKYNTEYTVRIEDVTSSSLPQGSTLEYRFQTGAPSLLYLDRGQPNDAILETGLTGSGSEVLYESPGIAGFAATGQVLVVSTVDAEGLSTLKLVNRTDGAIEEIRLPEPGTVSQLAVSDVGSVIALTFTPSIRSDDVFGGRRVLAMNLESGRELVQVGNLGGESLPVNVWRFIPGSTRMVIQGLEETAFVVDAAAAEGVPLPIGRFSEILGLSRDGTTLAASDTLGGIIVSLDGSGEERFEPSLIDGGKPFLGDVEPLVDGDRLQKAALQTTDGRFIVLLVVDDGETGRVIYETPNQAGSIERFTVSPNGQYVAIETVPIVAEAVSDGYLVDQRSTTITTVILEIETGLIVRSVEGFSLLW